LKSLLTKVVLIKNNHQLSIREVLASSRPFSWVNTVGPFFVGYTIANGSINLPCVVGAVYFCFFYNFLLYGVNDIFDYESDIKNPRKNSIEGGLVDKSKHNLMFALIIATNIPILIYLMATGSILSGSILALIIFFAFSYSAKPFRFKEVPILDSINSSLHFVMPLVFGLVYAGATSLPWPAIISFFLWGAASQALGAIQDIKPDRAGGIESIATKLGSKFTNRYSIILYTVSCIIPVIFYFPWGIAAGIILSLYPLNVLFFSRFKSDAKSSEYNRAWKNFLWINLLSGFWLSQLLLFVFDPLGLGLSRIALLGVFIIIIGLAQLSLTLYNYKKFTRPKTKRLNDLPHIDILLHSTGNKDNIASTLLALIGQNYPHFDIYYANLDNDPRSRKIAEGYQDKRLQMVDAGRTPAGWSQAAWASNVLFKKSKSDINVLISPDTILLPNTLSVIASMFDSSDLDLVSLLPADQNESLWQQLLMSQEHYLLLGLYPSAYITKNHPKLATAYSNLIAFKKSPLKKVGGFELTKNSPLEDLDIANKANQIGLNTKFYCASDLAVSQNRSGLVSLAAYNQQKLYPSLHFNMPLTVALISGGIFIISFPIFLLSALMLAGIYDGTILLAIGCALLLFNRLVVMVKSKQSISGALLYPLGCLAILLQLFTSMLYYELRKHSWKSRYEL